MPSGAYCASKSAVEALSHSLRQELAPFGVGVTLIAPGYVQTGILEKGKAEHKAVVARTRGSGWEASFARSVAYAHESIVAKSSVDVAHAAAVIVAAAEAGRAPLSGTCPCARPDSAAPV